MLNGCEVRVAFTGDLERGLTILAEELEKLGYQEKKRTPAELKMSFAGKWFTTDPAKMKHGVTVTSQGEELRFVFGTGLIASSWGASDVEWAQERADEVVAATRAHLEG